MPEYENKTIKYSVDGGTNWKTIILWRGCIHIPILITIFKSLRKQGHVKSDKTYGINLTFVLSTYKVFIELDDHYQVDFRASKFSELIVFEPKLVTQTEYGIKLPNITNSIGTINVHCDAITDSLGDGQNSNTITVIPTDDLPRSFPFLYEPRFLSCSPVASSTISKIRFYLTDSIGRPVNLNGIE